MRKQDRGNRPFSYLQEPAFWYWVFVVVVALMLVSFIARAETREYRVRWGCETCEADQVTHFTLQRDPGGDLELGSVEEAEGLYVVYLSFSETTRITVSAVNELGPSLPSNERYIDPGAVDLPPLSVPDAPTGLEVMACPCPDRPEVGP